MSWFTIPGLVASWLNIGGWEDKLETDACSWERLPFLGNVIVCVSSTVPPLKNPTTAHRNPIIITNDNNNKTYHYHYHYHYLNALFTFAGQFSSVCSTPYLLHPSHKAAIVSHMVYVRRTLR
jgi:hypothetical protein